jgi:hypothetical protein
MLRGFGRRLGWRALGGYAAQARSALRRYKGFRDP